MTLWLSRLTFTKRISPYGVHEKLWRAFSREANRCFLFRANEVNDGDVLRSQVMVQSTREPRWAELDEHLCTIEGPKELKVPVEVGRRLRFLLRANPTVSRKGRSEPKLAGLEGEAFRAERGRRVALQREADQVAWLERKALSAGFAIAEKAGEPVLRISDPFSVRWKKRGLKAGARHDGVDIEGVLVITEPSRFEQALHTGIGPGKAFGFGMLSLGRV